MGKEKWKNDNLSPLSLLTPPFHIENPDSDSLTITIYGRKIASDLLFLKFTAKHLFSSIVLE